MSVTPTSTLPDAVPFGDARLDDHAAFAQRLHEDGYVVVQNVFTPDEIARMREVVTGHLKRKGARFSLGKTQPNAAILVPGLREVIAHPRVVTLFKSLIGKENTVFTGHCDIHMNMLSGWHRDSGEAFGGYFTGDYIPDESVRVYKMAVYLQDATPSDGLFVVPKSHNAKSYDTGQAVQAKTKAGDVVIFDVRIAHVGQLPDTIEKGIKAINIALSGKSRLKEDSPIATWLKSVYWKLIRRRDRLSIFFTYGENNVRTNEFSESNMTRQNEQASASETAIPAPLANDLSEQGVKVFAA